MDRHDLYEICTQTPERDVELLRAIHGTHRPAGRESRGRSRHVVAARTLGEDFAGSAALARAWVRLVRGGRAIAVDHDPEPLARARGVRGVTARVADVRAVRTPVDLLVALNFSIGEWHDRKELVGYLANARRRLARGGLFACDLYGGDGAFQTGRLREVHRLEDGTRVRYEYEQREADGLTARVVNALHFTVEPPPGHARRQTWRDAFVYHWRLWSLPELREALAEAGFASSEVWSRFEHARDDRGRFHPLAIERGSDLPGDWCVFVVGRR